MRELARNELNKIIENHGHWLREDCYGWENMKADLSEVNLSETNLTGAHLLWANLSGADLSKAYLMGADLSNANLMEADLWKANLSEANLSGVNLSGANLSGANLPGVTILSANLSKANLSSANLIGANLSWANLSEADLSWANLLRACLMGVDLFKARLWKTSLWMATLQDAENIPYIPIACPDTGSFIAWKKVNGCIVKLLIPEDAKRCSATTTKCRCDKAFVLAIENTDGTDSGMTTLTNMSYATCVYTVGEMVYPDSWDNDRWNECSHGIHFFMNRQEAVNW